MFVKRYFNHSQDTKCIIQKLHMCVMCMHEHYSCSTELLIWWPFKLYTYVMRMYWASAITQPHRPQLKLFHKRLYSDYKMGPWVLNSACTYLTHRVRERRTDNSCNIHVATPHFMKGTKSLNIPSFCTHTECILRYAILTIKYFPKRHSLAGLCNWDAVLFCKADTEF